MNPNIIYYKNSETSTKKKRLHIIRVLAYIPDLWLGLPAKKIIIIYCSSITYSVKLLMDSISYVLHLGTIH